MFWVKTVLLPSPASLLALRNPILSATAWYSLMIIGEPIAQKADSNSFVPMRQSRLSSRLGKLADVGRLSICEPVKLKPPRLVPLLTLVTALRRARREILILHPLEASLVLRHWDSYGSRASWQHADKQLTSWKKPPRARFQYVWVWAVWICIVKSTMIYFGMLAGSQEAKYGYLTWSHFEVLTSHFSIHQHSAMFSWGLLKTLRVVRIFRFVMALRTLVTSIVFTLRSLFWALTLLVLIVPCPMHPTLYWNIWHKWSM